LIQAWQSQLFASDICTSGQRYAPGCTTASGKKAIIKDICSLKLLLWVDKWNLLEPPLEAP
jgi:hypothetical protein